MEREISHTPHPTPYTPTEATMNHSNDTASESGFPALFVVLSTFVGVIVWLCVMLNSLAP